MYITFIAAAAEEDNALFLCTGHFVRFYIRGHFVEGHFVVF
jgi:hypothetical protein